MNIEQFREFCLSLAGTSESMPFDDKTLVFKVMNKMFALTDIEGFESINLKCDPEKAIELREKYVSVQPGYHMNKKHWNTTRVNDELSDSQLQHWIRHSYDLVVSKLPKKVKEELKSLDN
ncbi:MAG: putative DNA-binding protein (MmcQ/YjbR family) [Flammeovirgaceae bacterium]|jgi:predicted DNA-binding protein (MmcQ/YjbR family)